MKENKNMNGWETIKAVRVELSEATFVAKKGKKLLSRECMKHAMLLLAKYLDKAKSPKYGFE